ncbi:MAG: sugar kinase [Acidimicrobiia bacterium]
MSYDIVTVGEALLRLWVPPGERLESAPVLRFDVAGSEANVAVAAARMGKSVAWCSRLPDTPLGRRVTRELAGHGVDVSHVRLTDSERMGAYFVELSVPPRPIHIIYDRERSAASAMTVEDVPWDLVESAGVVHLTGITPALSASCRETTLEVARRARASSVPVSVDVNYRNRLWEPQEAGKVLTELCASADLVIVTEEDARDVFGLAGTPSELLDAMSDLTKANHVVLTRGAAGASWRSAGVDGDAPGYEAEILDRVGAGDALAGGVLVGFLEDDLSAGVRLGLAMAAITIGMFGDQLRSSPDEIRTLMEGGGREVSR